MKGHHRGLDQCGVISEEGWTRGATIDLGGDRGEYTIHSSKWCKVALGIHQRATWYVVWVIMNIGLRKVLLLELYAMVIQCVQFTIVSRLNKLTGGTYTSKKARAMGICLL